MNLETALKKIASGDVLTQDEAQSAMGDIADGNAKPLQIAAVLGALRMRGETTDEIAGFISAMQERVVPVRTQSADIVDTCGTGGDAPKHGIATFNISTAAAFIAAGVGAKIAKHGNRAQSSRCGSADALEALGIRLDLTPEQIAHCIDEIGIGFMFAQAHHPAMKHVGPIRRELGIRTVFNLFMPLVNPAGASSQVMGVSDHRWIRPIAEVLLQLGRKHAIVAHSQDGMDEFSTCAPTDYIEVKDGKLVERVLNPHELGCACSDAKLLEGGDATQNAVIIQQLLHDGEGPTADIACLNAAAVLIVAGIAPDFPTALPLARASANSGAAREKLMQLIKYSQSV